MYATSLLAHLKEVTVRRIVPEALLLFSDEHYFRVHEHGPGEYARAGNGYQFHSGYGLPAAVAAAAGFAGAANWRPPSAAHFSSIAVVTDFGRSIA